MNALDSYIPDLVGIPAVEIQHVGPGPQSVLDRFILGLAQGVGRAGVVVEVDVHLTGQFGDDAIDAVVGNLNKQGKPSLITVQRD